MIESALRSTPPVEVDALVDLRASGAGADGLVRDGGGAVREAARWAERNALFLIGLAGVAMVSAVTLPAHMNQDAWLALVDGRYIASHGIPFHDSLNVMTHGVRWVDQQWLAQLLLYELTRLGGLALYAFVYLALTVLALGIAMSAARSLGGRDNHIVWVLPAAGILYLVGAFQVRTQGLAYPLFAATLWLLAADARRISGRRIYLVFPILILWGNLHGSATLGAGLVVLRGVTQLVEQLGASDGRRAWQRIGTRPLVLIGGAVLCLFVTPYGSGIVHYYHATLFNSTFSQLISEWRPVTSVTAFAVPFFVVAAASVWLLGRSGSRTCLFDQLTVIVLAALAVFAIRNITWFGLTELMLLPATISGLRRTNLLTVRRTTVNLALAGVAVALLCGSALATAVRPASWFQRMYPERAVRVVASSIRQDPAIRIYADVRFSDWLQWRDPGLAGRIAYDIRFELLSGRQLEAIAHVADQHGPGNPNVIAPYGLLVLDPGRDATPVLLHNLNVHILLRNRRVVIATTRPAGGDG